MAKGGAENRAGQSPEIKFTHQMTPTDIDHIARVTGGRLSVAPELPTFYRGDERIQRRPVSVHLAGRDTFLNFTGSPVEIALGVRSARLEMKGTNIDISNTAVILGGDAITFVHAPEAVTVPPGVRITTLRVSKDEILYRRQLLPQGRSVNLDPDVMRAANMVDKAVRDRYNREYFLS